MILDKPNSTYHRYYTGIGSRETPYEVCQLMTAIGKSLAKKQLILRTGGADGADNSFLRGSKLVKKSRCQLFLPWDGFNGHHHPFECKQNNPCAEAVQIAIDYHPNWMDLSQPAKKLMARNSYQILGDDLFTPSKFVICYTPNGSGKGGTGQALRIANDHDIPILDLGKYKQENMLDELKQFILDIKNG